MIFAEPGHITQDYSVDIPMIPAGSLAGRKILDIGAGFSAFAFNHLAAGRFITLVDPIYGLPNDELRQQVFESLVSGHQEKVGKIKEVGRLLQPFGVSLTDLGQGELGNMNDFTSHKQDMLVKTKSLEVIDELITIKAHVPEKFVPLTIEEYLEHEKTERFDLVVSRGCIGDGLSSSPKSAEYKGAVDVSQKILERLTKGGFYGIGAITGKMPNARQARDAIMTGAKKVKPRITINSEQFDVADMFLDVLREEYRGDTGKSGSYSLSFTKL